MEVLEEHIYIYLYICIYATSLQIIAVRGKHTLQSVKANFWSDLVRVFVLDTDKGTNLKYSQTFAVLIAMSVGRFLERLAPRMQLMPKSLARYFGIKKETQKFRNLRLRTC